MSTFRWHMAGIETSYESLVVAITLAGSNVAPPSPERRIRSSRDCVSGHATYTAPSGPVVRCDPIAASDERVIGLDQFAPLSVDRAKRMPWPGTSHAT